MSSRIVRRATAQWWGDVTSGAGNLALGSNAFNGAYSLRSRIDNVPQANPEELLGAASAACFSMSLSHVLTSQGAPPRSIDTSARVLMVEVAGDYHISHIYLDVVGDVPGCDHETFNRLSVQAEKECPVSRALAGVEIVLNARLADGEDARHVTTH